MNAGQPVNQSTNQLINPSTNQLINSSTISYALHLADNALILGQRNAEWTGHGPILEQDIAISNIALDLVGQARNFYQYAAQLINQSTDQYTDLLSEGAATEDTLAYLRAAADFKNCLLVELPKSDWAVTVLRQFFFSTYQFYLYRQLVNSKDSTLAAIAEKSVKETAYHVRWSAEWVIRLGDGTDESKRRTSDALRYLWPFTAELTINAPYETALLQNAIAADLNTVKQPWMDKIKEVLQEATLQWPGNDEAQTGGKEGLHTNHLPVLLKDMQYLQRTHPGATW